MTNVLIEKLEEYFMRDDTEGLSVQTVTDIYAIIKKYGAMGDAAIREDAGSSETASASTSSLTNSTSTLNPCPYCGGHSCAVCGRKLPNEITSPTGQSCNQAYEEWHDKRGVWPRVFCKESFQAGWDARGVPSEIPVNIEPLIDDLIFKSWDFGSDCAVDQIAWANRNKEGDSHIKWQREKMEEAKQKLLAGIAVEQKHSDIPSNDIYTLTNENSVLRNDLENARATLYREDVVITQDELVAKIKDDVADRLASSQMIVPMPANEKRAEWIAKRIAEWVMPYISTKRESVKLRLLSGAIEAIRTKAFIDGKRGEAISIAEAERLLEMFNITQIEGGLNGAS